jgi:iron complex outermembrane receptor protein
VCVHSWALAQDVSATPPAQVRSSDSTRTGSGELGEIVVTAEKKSESLQKTPIAITAVSGDALISAGITDITAVATLVPDVHFAFEGQSTNLYIRGVGALLNYVQIDNPTSINFNGVYIPREGTGSQFFDLERVEVVPGPQGTLYGRSTLGGAANIYFARPSFEKDQSSALVEGGNYGLFHGTFVGNIVASDTLAIRGAVDYLRHTGYQTSGSQSLDDPSGRLSVVWRPTDDTNAYLWGYYSEMDGSPPNVQLVGVNEAGNAVPGAFPHKNPWQDTYTPAQLALPANPFLPPPQQAGKSSLKYDTYFVGGEINQNLGSGLTLTYVPSYGYIKNFPYYWIGAYSSQKTDLYKQNSHEFRLSGESSKLSWLTGLYYYRLVSSSAFIFADSLLVSDVTKNRLMGAAAFGQATYHISDSLRITAGGRFSHDDRIGAGIVAPTTPFTYGAKFSHVDWKVGTEYDVAPQVMLYGAIQTGYQPGTFNAYPSTATVSNAVQQATLTAYTAGVKSRLFDNILQVNDEVFYYDYRDLFESSFNVILNTTQTFNAKKVAIYGNQLDVVLAPTRNDALNVSVGYLHARNVSFELPDGTANYNGLSLTYSPTITVTAGYHHDFRTSGGYVRVAASTYHESTFYGDFTHSPGTVQYGYWKEDASATYLDDKGWSFGIWGKNLSNKAVLDAASAGSNLPLLADGAGGYLQPPRTYGVRLQQKF